MIDQLIEKKLKKIKFITNNNLLTMSHCYDEYMNEYMNIWVIIIISRWRRC